MGTVSKKKCVGCGACAVACPQKCIEMQADNEGFLYPYVNQKVCTDCGKCEKVCLYNNPVKGNFAIKAFGGYTKNSQIHMDSSSGGLFSELALYVLSKGGVVFGVGLSADCRKAKYCEINLKEELKNILGSKYVQAETEDIFVRIKDRLENSKMVLFSGTPCLVNALKIFLNKNYPNLICVDIICHGVPSQKLWKKYVCYVEERYSMKIIGVNFRSKKKSWLDFGMDVSDNVNKVYFSKDKDPYMQMFLRNLSLRPSCYNCIAKTERMSDLTIGDFWGVNSVAPELFNEKGVSVIVVRTETGINLFDCISNNIVYKEVDYYEAIKSNEAEKKSVEMPIYREEFFRYMDNNSIDYLYTRFCKDKFSVTVRRMLSKIKHSLGGGQK